MNLVTEIAMAAAVLVLMAGLLFSLVIGVLAIVDAERVLRLADAVNRRISLRPHTRFLEAPVTIEAFFFRHHRIFGFVIGVLALYLIYYLSVRYSRSDVMVLIEGSRHAAAIAVVLDVAHLLLWLGAVFALAVAAVVFVRPSLLKAVEARSNTWLSTRRAMRRLEDDVGSADGLWRSRPRLAGAVLVVVSLVLLAGLIPFWARL